VIPADERPAYVGLLDETTQKDVAGLLAFAEDDAGGLMHPRYVRIRPDLSVDEAITYLRKAARDKLGTLYYAYVLDAESHLLGVVSLRDLFVATPDKRVRDVMRTEIVVADETMDQEALARLFKQHASSPARGRRRPHEGHRDGRRHRRRRPGGGDRGHPEDRR
jgi:magnesium transporter